MTPELGTFQHVSTPANVVIERADRLRKQQAHVKRRNRYIIIYLALVAAMFIVGSMGGTFGATLFTMIVWLLGYGTGRYFAHE